jgi:hypothetical protein
VDGPQIVVTLSGAALIAAIVWFFFPRRPR